MIGQLTAIRGPLALWVVVYHFVGKSFAPADLGWAQPVLDKGYLAVDAFFVLSGLIIAHTWQQHDGERGRRGTAEFLWARFARIYPAHLAVLVAFLVAMAMATAAGRTLAGEYTATGLLWHVLLIDAWGITDTLGWNYPSWSISAEWFAYLLVPVVFLRLLSADRGLTAVVVAAGLAVLAVADTGLASGGLASWTDARALLRISAEFAIGVAIAAQVRQGVTRQLLLLCVGLLAIGTGIAIGVDVVTVAAMALVLAVLYAWPPMSVPPWALTLGVWSYSVYLVHALIQVVAQTVVGTATLTPTGQVAGLVASVAVTIATAGALHHLVEDPARRWLRDRRPGRAGPVPAGGEPSAPSGGDVQVVLVQGIAEGPAAGAVEGPRRTEVGHVGVEQPTGQFIGR